MEQRQISGPAGDHPVDDPDRHSRPHHPRRGCRGPQPRFCANLASQGSFRMGRDPARIEECDAAGHGGHGVAVRLSARRLDPGRNGVHLARQRLSAEQGDHQSRRAGIAGNDLDPVAGLCRRQFGRRSAAIADRSKDQTGVTDYSSVIPAKAGIQGRRALEGRPLDPRFREGDDVEPLDKEQALPATRVRGYWQSVFYRLGHDPVTLVFGAIVLLIVLAAVFAPLLAPFDPYKESIVGRLKPFGWRGHPLGTDELERDMLSRLIYGGRVSLLMGVVPVLIASLVGGMLGVLGGFFGGRTNTAIMRTMDVF